MAIYTYATATRINLVTARLADVWREDTPRKIKLHSKRPLKIGKLSKLTLLHVWHVRATFAETSSDGSIKFGEPAFGGDERSMNYIGADGGWPELKDALYRLNPVDGAKEERLFPPPQ